MRSLLLGLLLLPVLVGCGAGKVKVSGRVLYNGNPLPGGIVSFRPADPKHNAVSAEVDEQGNYEAVLPAGEVQVAVDNRELQPPTPSGPAGLPPGLPADVQNVLNKERAKAAPPPADQPAAPRTPNNRRGTYVPIPEKYYTTDKSGLTFTVEPGNPKHDIELK
jgi:hypothetical protein